mgnify:FL=1|tara:strand:+ start:464 stop:1054 length:591 start_codon:yes stop_codon:yes gene_type:complete
MDQKPFNDIFAQTNGQERSARWYQNAVRDYAAGINTFQEVQSSDLGKVATQLDVGKMYMFAYDPMTKETLPYWDSLPLVVICDPLPTGFSGINLHYLSPLLRANLLDRLMPSIDKVDSDSKLRSDWSFVRNFSRFPETRKSTKRYLTQQIRGQMIEVNPRHWKSAIFLPVQQFQGASASKVYRDTMAKPERRRRQV